MRRVCTGTAVHCGQTVRGVARCGPWVAVDLVAPGGVLVGRTDVDLAALHLRPASARPRACW